MYRDKITLGREGECRALEFLKKNRYDIIRTNYRCCCGQIDIIAKLGKFFCFIEVKTRKTKKFGEPEESITEFKQRKISQSALYFLKEHKLQGVSARFDVISIYCPDGADTQIRHMQDAFPLSKEYFY